MQQQTTSGTPTNEAGGVLGLSPEHARILRGVAQDTGAFRANNKQASDLAAAAASALRIIEANAELQQKAAGAIDMLRESAKQHRQQGDAGHGRGAELHADALDAALRATGIAP